MFKHVTAVTWLRGECVNEYGFTPESGCRGFDSVKIRTNKDQHSRAAICLGVPPISLDLPQASAYVNCVHNQVCGIGNRVLTKTPEPQAWAVKVTHKVAKSIANKIGMVVKQPIMRVLLNYTGAKLRNYRRALDELLREGLRLKDWIATAFVKWELKDPLEKRLPNPRIIQYYSAKFNLVLMQYIKPVEYRIYRLLGLTKYMMAPFRTIGKGLNNSERGKLLHDVWQWLERATGVKYVVYSIDARGFDFHVGLEQREIENIIFTRCVRDPEFRELLDKMVNTKVISTEGLVYYTMKRRSGEVQTAVGNCVVVEVNCISAWETFGQKFYWHPVIDGDDTLVFIPEDIGEKFMDHFKKFWEALGHELRFCKKSTRMEDIEWCQCHPVEVNPGEWIMVRDIRKTLAYSTTGLRFTTSERRQRLIMSLIGYCTLALARGVPIIQKYAQTLLRIAGPVSFEHLRKKTSTKRRTKLQDILDSEPALRKRQIRVWLELRSLGVDLEQVTPRLVTAHGRSSFAKAFGVSVQQQHLVEAELDMWQVKFGDPGQVIYQSPKWVK